MVLQLHIIRIQQKKPLCQPLITNGYKQKSRLRNFYHRKRDLAVTGKARFIGNLQSQLWKYLADRILLLSPALAET